MAAHDDESVPLHRRLLRRPNTWPDPETFPSFRPTVEELTRVYHRLTHDLGRLTLECLGEDPAHFDQLFNFEDPDLAASLNHNFSLEAIAPHLREKVSASYDALKAPLGVTGAHIDGPPFFALLINDRPGLQVVAGEGRWSERVKRIPSSPANADGTDAPDVAHVDGPTRTFVAQKMIQEFHNGKEPHRPTNPDEAVASGAAVQAATSTSQHLTKNIVPTAR